MGRLELHYERKLRPDLDKKALGRLTCKKSDFRRFNPAMLDVGKIDTPSTTLDAIVAVFDLTGFTNFCRQTDPQLVLPSFLSKFLTWLFSEIRKATVADRVGNDVFLFSSLPFIAKFTGDGVLFIWKTDRQTVTGICNIIVACDDICRFYTKTLLPKLGPHYVEPPTKLRCGVARGLICSVGNGTDYVGPCINIASRLANMSDLSICFNPRGFDLEKSMDKEVRKGYIIKKVRIRGVGDHELVGIRKDELSELRPEDKQRFKNP
jgi:class 3 adenylate cyclase